MVDALTEWTSLGLRLLQLCPDKFEEIVECLRDTVGVHEILASQGWIATFQVVRSAAPKA